MGSRPAAVAGIVAASWGRALSELKPSPWAGQPSDDELAKPWKPRFRIAQPMWFSVLVWILGAGVCAAGLTAHELWPNLLGSLAFWVLAGLGPLVATGLTFTGRLELQERGLLIRRVGGSRFVAYRQLDSVRDCWTRPDERGRQARYLEVHLTSGDTFKLDGDDEMRRSIVAAWTAWIRATEDAKTPADEHGPDRSPYRGKQQD